MYISARCVTDCIVVTLKKKKAMVVWLQVDFAQQRPEEHVVVLIGDIMTNNVKSNKSLSLCADVCVLNLRCKLLHMYVCCL